MARSQVRAKQPHPRKPTHYKPLIEALEDRLVLDGWGLNLDFGTPDSPVDKAFIQFGTGAAGSKEGDFGWTNPARVEAYDTGLGSDLTRDGVRGIMNTFTAKVPNGKYEVSALLGNARSYNDRITVYSNQGIVVANLTDYRQRFVPVNFIAEVSDGNFRLTIVDAGGLYRHFSLASLQIQQLTPGGGNQLSASAGNHQVRQEGENFTFQGTGQGGKAPYELLWNFGDGTQSTGSLTPSKTFADNGTYTVTLTVTDANRSQVTSSVQVTVNNVAPTATFTAAGAVQAGTPGLVQFTGQFDPSAADTAAGFR
ncbi:MAG TPA: PKD domain-containing protein [Gemmatales bacterium]|nr:PKD domain-containing protein [Gemmatales bacterium]